MSDEGGGGKPPGGDLAKMLTDVRLYGSPSSHIQTTNCKKQTHKNMQFFCSFVTNNKQFEIHILTILFRHANFALQSAHFKTHKKAKRMTKGT